jgi:secondary thiamine-phosphate synthase enzyme
MYKIDVTTHKRCELVNIDSLLEKSLSEHDLRDGVLVIFVPHTTAGILINENADPDVKHDILSSLESKIPFEEGYRHSEGNSAAHIKACLVGSSVLIPVEAGVMQLGTWQSVFFAEFDGPRHRQIVLIFFNA